MTSSRPYGFLLTTLLAGLCATSANAQSFRVQCPSVTSLHTTSGAAAAFTGSTTTTRTITRADGSTLAVAYSDNGGTIKCQQISGGDGFVTMADGTQSYLFGFGPLSGLADLVHALPGTQLASVFNASNVDAGNAVLPDIAIGAPTPDYAFNGAIGLVPDVYGLDPWAPATVYPANTTVRNGPNLYYTQLGGTSAASGSGPAGTGSSIADGSVTWASQSPLATGHVDPRLIMDVGVMNATEPAPMMAIDEDDEFFLTLTNVGMVMRPDLFEQHTVHFHGYPNASSFYDGVPDASVAINIGGSFTYYYLAPDAGTYFWHCHITPPEHLQMGMVGQIYVRPRQNRVPATMTLYQGLAAQQSDPRTRSDCTTDVLCTSPLPAGGDNGRTGGYVNGAATKTFAYNDGNGSTQYEVEYPIQMMGFDPNFHFVGMTFNPEGFADMKDKYYMLNGRGYPDTVAPGTMQTQSTDGTLHSSQPLPTIVNIPAGGRALLRISDLNVSEYHTLASLGIAMRVIALNARLLRDEAGNDMTYLTNSITLGGGESLDVILDACQQRDATTGNCTTPYAAGQKFYLYTPQLDHLANDAENFGGMMTEVNICNTVDPATKQCS